MIRSGESIQYRISEWSFEAREPVADPLSVALEMRFTGPGGAALTVAGFFDGGKTWRVRFAPPAAGRWAYSLRVTPAVPGLETASGHFDAEPAAGANLLHRHGGFLRVGPSRRHLTYTDGTPFFWLGDTWWFCPSDLVPFERSNRPGEASTFRRLVDVRAQQGYTVVHMASLGKLTAGGADSGVSGQYSDLFEGRVNADYWRAYDAYVAYANERGLLPVLGFGFHQGLNAPSLEALQRLWRYVVARYGAFAVGWLICGEYNQAGGKAADGKSELTEQDARRVEKVRALGEFIKDCDPYERAMTVHPWWHGGEKRQAWNDSWYDFVLLQGGHGKEGPAPAFYTDVAGSAGKPFIEGEVTYEGIFGFSDGVVRHNAYKAMQCGSAGFTYGAQGLWYPNQDESDTKFSEWGPTVPWWQALERRGGAQMRHLRACYESLEWWRLEPVSAGRLLSMENLASGATFQALASGYGHDAFVVYVPAHRPADAARPVELAWHGGRPGALYRVTVFDPRSGESFHGGEVPGGVRSALPALPDTQDWVLLFRRAVA